MTAYVLICKDQFSGAYRTRAKAKFAAMQKCKQDENLMFHYDLYCKQDRHFFREALNKGQPYKCITFLDYIFLSRCKILPVEMQDFVLHFFILGVEHLKKALAFLI